MPYPVDAGLHYLLFRNENIFRENMHRLQSYETDRP